MKRILLFIINAYQKTSGPWHGLCKYYPTCSNYAKESITIHGSLKGTLLSIKRILKCNPFGSIKYDPVPLKKEEKYEKENN